MADIRIAKWGNSLALRLPRGIAKGAGLAEGDCLSAEVAADGSVVLRAVRPRYTLEELVAGITPKNRHKAVDWGKSRGKEIW